MASHGRRGISKVLLGSQAMKVVTLSPVPILVCRCQRRCGNGGEPMGVRGANENEPSGTSMAASSASALGGESTVLGSRCCGSLSLAPDRVHPSRQYLGSPCRLVRRCASGAHARRWAAASAARPRADQLVYIYDHHAGRIVDVGVGGNPLPVGGRRNPVKTQSRAWQHRLIAIRTTVRDLISAP
jgi:Universal stress protein family